MAARSTSDNHSGKPGASRAPGDFLPMRGERALIVGQTGSGKTQFVRWLLERSPLAPEGHINSPCVIYDTKDEPKFETLPRSRIVTSEEEASEAIDDESVDYVVWRFPHRILTQPAVLDGFLENHYLNWQGVDCYIDELYQFHDAGRAGPGLMALYTRGRSKGITTLAATQRPAWISRFAISEAQKFYMFFLGLEDDLKRMQKDARMGVVQDPDEFHFWFKRQGREDARLMKPIKLDDGAKHGYIDAPAVAGTDIPTHEIRRIVWI
jgi:energy-coupling factor transporter ATP-binding protein EcfA2